MKIYDVVLFTGSCEVLVGKSFGVYRLTSHLRQNGYSVKTINHFQHLSDAQFQKCVDKFVSDKTKIVGLGCTTIRSYQTGDFFGIPDSEMKTRIDYIKSKGDIKLVLGGGQVNYTAPKLYYKFKDFDYVSFGQGENTFLAICNHIFKGEKLITNTIQKPYHVTDKTYPFNEFHCNQHIFTEDDDIVDGEALPLELARGCVFKCKFCSYELNGKSFHDYTKNEEILYNELIYNYTKFKTQYYYIIDDLINDSEEKVDMLERVIKRLPFKIYFGGYMRLDLLYNNDKMIRQLKDIGLVGSFFGIETINDKSGKVIGKGLGLKRIESTLQRCREIWGDDVHVEGNFILGLPYDDEQTPINLLNWLRKAIGSKWLNKSIVVPLSINTMLRISDIDAAPQKYGYKIFSYEKGIRSRYNSHEAKWIINGYSFEQARNDAFHINHTCQKEFGIEKQITKYTLPVIYSRVGNIGIKNCYAKIDSLVDEAIKIRDTYIDILLEKE